jgi:hypothetical protein
MEVPTVYMREPIGVDGALEATQAIHFCSTDCRERWQNWHPDKEGTDAIGFNTDGELIDGEVCNACGADLEASMKPHDDEQEETL